MLCSSHRHFPTHPHTMNSAPAPSWHRCCWFMAVQPQDEARARSRARAPALGQWFIGDVHSHGHGWGGTRPGSQPLQWLHVARAEPSPPARNTPLMVPIKHCSQCAQGTGPMGRATARAGEATAGQSRAPQHAVEPGGREAWGGRGGTQQPALCSPGPDGHPDHSSHWCQWEWLGEGINKMERGTGSGCRRG